MDVRFGNVVPAMTDDSFPKGKCIRSFAVSVVRPVSGAHHAEGTDARPA